MYKSINNMRSSLIKKVGIVSAILLLVVLTLNIFKISKNAKLDIKVTPQNATVAIDEKQSFIGDKTLNIPKGDHKIKVSANGFITQEKQISLTKNQQVIIILEEIKEVTENEIEVKEGVVEKVGQEKLHELKINFSGIIYAIDANENLVKISTSGVKKIYQGRVRNFSVNGGLVAFIDTTRNDTVFIYNDAEGNTKEFIFNQLKPIISVTLKDDNQSVYIIGKYNPVQRISEIYKFDINNPNPQKISNTNALTIEYSKNDLMIEFLEIDDSDKSVVIVSNVTNGGIIYSNIGNEYLLSPNKESIAIKSSSRITVYNLRNLVSSYTASTSKEFISWVDDSNIAITENTSQGIKYTNLNINKMSRDASIMLTNTNADIQKVFGILEDAIYFKDNSGNIQRLYIP